MDSESETSSVHVDPPKTNPISARIFKTEINPCSLRFFPSGQKFIASSSRCHAAIWDLETGREVAQTSPKRHRHKFALLHVAVSRDGSMVATSSHDDTIKVWRVGGSTENGGDGGGRVDGGDGTQYSNKLPEMELIRVLESDAGAIGAIDFSADGRRIASTGGKTVMVWNIEDGSLSFDPIRCGCVRYLLAIRYSPDGLLLAAGLDQIYIWKAETGEAVRTIQVPPSGFVWTPDGTRIIYGDDDGLVVLDVDSGDRLHSFAIKPARGKFSKIVRCLNISPDGLYVLSLRDLAQDGILSVTDIRDGNEVVRFQHDLNETVCDAVFSPSGDTVAVLLLERRVMYFWPFPPKNDGESSDASSGQKSSPLFNLDLPAIPLPPRLPEDIGLGSLIDLSRVTRPAPHNSSATTSPRYPLLKLRALFRRSPATPPQDDNMAIESRKRSRWSQVTRVSYAQARSVWAAARKTPPRQNLPVPLSDHETSVTGGHAHEPGDSGAASGQGADVGTRHSQHDTSAAAPEMQSQSEARPRGTSTMPPSPAHANPHARGQLQIDTDAGSNDSFEADCCWCCACCCLCLKKR